MSRAAAALSFSPQGPSAPSPLFLRVATKIGPV
jgi:hypothetical protein